MGVCSFYKRGGQPPYNLPAVHLRFTPRSLQVCLLAHFNNEAPTNKKYEEKMHIEASKTGVPNLLSYLRGAYGEHTGLIVLHNSEWTPRTAPIILD